MAHQMNRDVERRGQDAKPQLSDLAEGGERPCDTVIFIHHERAGDMIKNSSLIIAKNRNGPTPEIPVVFKQSAFRFESAAKVRF
jgi:replicative DNA helicase